MVAIVISDLVKNYLVDMSVLSVSIDVIKTIKNDNFSSLTFHFYDLNFRLET